MSVRIVVDSSADARSWDTPVDSVPLKIIVGEREFTDDETLDVAEMVDYLATYKGRSGTACPNAGEWANALAADPEADMAFGVTITGALSGSYDAAHMGQKHLEAEGSALKIHIFDSLSTGPEMRLLVEKIKELAAAGLPFETIRDKVEEYRVKTTHLIFSLESLNNLANNGRVNPAVAKLAGMLNVRVVGRASEKGELDPFAKARGERKMLKAIVKEMRAKGYAGGKAFISHVLNATGARQLEALIKEEWPNARVATYAACGLVSFYAERNGLLIGYESE